MALEPFAGKQQPEKSPSSTKLTDSIAEPLSNSSTAAETVSECYIGVEKCEISVGSLQPHLDCFFPF